MIVSQVGTADKDARPGETRGDLVRALTQQEVADRLGVSKRQVERMVHEGVLPVLRVGRLVRISLDAVAEYIAQNQTYQVRRIGNSVIQFKRVK